MWKRRDLIQNDLASFPPLSRRNQMLFNSTHVEVCHTSANALFQLFTSYDTNLVDHILSGGSSEIQLERNSPVERECVHYLIYVWEASNPTELTHHLLYYKGFIYQSYRTSRYQWFPSIHDGYPLIKVPVTDPEVRQILSERPCDLSIDQFNDWCAPSNHPIPNSVPFKLAKHYKALLNPNRSIFQFELSSMSL